MIFYFNFLIFISLSNSWIHIFDKENYLNPEMWRWKIARDLRFWQWQLVAVWGSANANKIIKYNEMFSFAIRPKTPYWRKVVPRLDFLNLGSWFRNTAQRSTTLRDIAKCLEFSNLSFILKAYYEKIVKRSEKCEYLVVPRLAHWRQNGKTAEISFS